MPAAPRLRQVRRDPTVFDLLMNVVRLDLEDDERLGLLPALATTPDDDLLALRRSRQQWLVLAASYVLRRFRCSPQQAAQLVQQVLAELHDEADPAEVRATPLHKVHPVPPALLPPSQRPSTAPGT